MSPGAPPVPAPSRPRTGLATASLLLGLAGNAGLGPLAGIPGVITGHLALRRARRDPSTTGGRGRARLGLVLGYLSFVVGFVVLSQIIGAGVPALLHTREKTEAVDCQGRLKRLGTAARIHAEDHGGLFPERLADLGPLLNSATLFVCPSDAGRTPLAGTNWSQFTPEHASYEPLAPGAREKASDEVPIFRCPVHGHVVLGSGSVRLK